MSKELTKESVIQHKKQSIKSINQLLEHYINSSNPKHLKKADLLSYWFENFCDYIKNEETYSPKHQIAYKRGDVLKVNFGFNVGKEYGGLHYAIVIDKQNARNANVVTVIPLTSGTKNDTHPKDVYLGTELYNKLDAKHRSILEKSQNELDKLLKLSETLEKMDNILSKTLEKEVSETNELEYQNITNEFFDKYTEFIEVKKERNNAANELQKDIEFIEKSQAELDKIKAGSIALIEQITTIDKARIFTPRKSRDVLYGISFSDEKMDLINNAIKKLYVF